MVIFQKISKRKASGGRYVAGRKSRQFDKGSKPTLSKVGPEQRKVVKGLGGNVKTRVMHSENICVFDAKAKKSVKVKIKHVDDNPANRNFVRRSIITKGTIVDTEKGKVRVTSRPGQDGNVCGVFI